MYIDVGASPLMRETRREWAECRERENKRVREQWCAFLSMCMRIFVKYTQLLLIVYGYCVWLMTGCRLAGFSSTTKAIIVSFVFCPTVNVALSYAVWSYKRGNDTKYCSMNP